MLFPPRAAAVRTACQAHPLCHARGGKIKAAGKVIGTRTRGGEIWLSFSNVLVDRGLASAAETGVYGPEGAWLIEGHGVDPDIKDSRRPEPIMVASIDNRSLFF